MFNVTWVVMAWMITIYPASTITQAQPIPFASMTACMVAAEEYNAHRSNAVMCARTGADLNSTRGQ